MVCAAEQEVCYLRAEEDLGEGVLVGLGEGRCEEEVVTLVRRGAHEGATLALAVGGGGLPAGATAETGDLGDGMLFLSDRAAGSLEGGGDGIGEGGGSILSLLRLRTINDKNGLRTYSTAVGF